MEVGGSVVFVGLMFSISHAVNVFAGPWVGLIIDRLGKRSLVVWGQSLSAIVFALPIILSYIGIALTIPILSIMTLTSAVGVLLMSGSLEAIQQQIATKTSTPQTRMSAIAGSIRQGFMVAGVGSAGMIIHYTSIDAAFFCCAVSCLGTVLFMYGIPNYRASETKKSGAFFGIKEGFVSLVKTPEIGRLSLLIALGFSVGQMSNALLPGIVQDEIHAGSRTFAIVDALWSTGGILFAFLMVYVPLRYLKFKLEYFAALVLGAFMVLASITQTPLSLMATYIVLGGAFSILKVTADGKILELCHPDLIGRTRTNIQSITSLIGLTVYLSPYLLSISSAGTVFYYWGMLVMFCSSILLFATRASNGL